MVSLSDDEPAAVMDSARPLPAQARYQFLREVAAELAKHESLGPGIVGLGAGGEIYFGISARAASREDDMWLMPDFGAAAFVLSVALLVILMLTTG